MAKAKTKAVAETADVMIAPPNLKVAIFTIIGTAPYVQEKFSEKARRMMMEKHKAGSVAKKGTKREARDFDADYEAAMHKIEGGGWGIPAPAFRNSMIDACRLTGYAMTQGKMSVFCLPDAFDSDDATPLVRITKGKPEKFIAATRNATGVADLRARPKWSPGWEATVRIQFDADQFTLSDVANLLSRAGAQVGIGAGRPFSKKSAGMGWGTFRVANKKEVDGE
jgi:hypothetical protein